jgi:hypothetical protein
LNPQIEEGRLRDFFDYYSDRYFPTECVQTLVCEGPMLQNFLRQQFTDVRNKLECLFLANLSSLIFMFVGKAAALLK